MEPIFTAKGLAGWLGDDIIWDTQMKARAFVRDDGIFSFRGSGYRGFIHEGVLRNTSSLTVAFLGEARRAGITPPTPPSPPTPPMPPTPPTPPPTPPTPPTPPIPAGFLSAADWDSFLG